MRLSLRDDLVGLEKCGFYQTYLSRIEEGNANPSLNAMEVIAKALGLTVFELFDKVKRPVSEQMAGCGQLVWAVRLRICSLTRAPCASGGWQDCQEWDMRVGEEIPSDSFVLNCRNCLVRRGTVVHAHENPAVRRFLCKSLDLAGF